MTKASEEYQRSRGETESTFVPLWRKPGFHNIERMRYYCLERSGPRHNGQAHDLQPLDSEAGDGSHDHHKRCFYLFIALAVAIDDN